MSHKTAEDCLEVIGRIEKVLNIEHPEVIEHMEEEDDGSEYLSEPDDPKKKVAVLRHNDADGFGSAYAIWKALKDTCELLFIPVQYGQEPPYEALRNFAPEEIYIVDFSYDFDTLKALFDEFKDVTILDHHKTSKGTAAQVEALLELRFNFIHNESCAGCTLTWDYFFSDSNDAQYHPPEILLYVQDRDLWKFDLEHSKEINAFIATMDEDFAVWDDFYTPEAYDCGKAILKFQGEQIKRRLKDVVLMSYMTEKGVKPFCKPLGNGMIFAGSVLIPLVNASDNISELGEAMCLAYPDAPFSVSYCDRADGNRSYSLRSRNGFDVSAVAKTFGGGGHKSAGGFTLSAPEII